MQKNLFQGTAICSERLLREFSCLLVGKTSQGRSSGEWENGSDST